MVKKDEETLKQSKNKYEQEKKIIEDDLNSIDADVVGLGEKAN